MTQRILILDFGSQVTQLIARRVRESGVYCEILPYNISAGRLAEFAPAAIILSGGPASVHEREAPLPRRDLRDGRSGPRHLLRPAGDVRPARRQGRALGPARVRSRLHRDHRLCALFEGLWPRGSREQVWMSHGDRVEVLPPGFRVVAVSEGAPFAVVADDRRRFYGTMFHPEVIHTPQGAALIRNFTHRVAQCRGDWTMAAFRAQAVERVRHQVGTGRVICGLSGGVNFAVAAVLLHEAIGDQLTCIFVDTGLLRGAEAEEVVTLFRDHYNIPLVHRDASTLFLGKLGGVEEPEQKRKVIGATLHRRVR